MENRYLRKTRMLDYDNESIKNLVKEHGWEALDEYQKIGAIYDFVRNDILFGYNRSDLLSADEVLTDGYGQCNTKATLLMTLLRAVGIPSRLHGSEVDKHFQEGVITDEPYMLSVKKQYIGHKGSFAHCAISVPDLKDLSLEWKGSDIFVQNGSVVKDYGVFDDPDTFFEAHPQTWSKVKDFAYVHYGRKKMNRTVRKMRAA